MSVQTTYPENIPVGYAGQIANQEPCVLISRTVETTAGLPFGTAVIQGTADKGVIIGTDAAFLGVVVRTQSVDPAFPSGYAEDDEARIMTKGVVWVVANSAVSAGDVVKALASGELGTGGGTFTVPNARWDTSADDGDLALLRLA